MDDRAIQDIPAKEYGWRWKCALTGKVSIGYPTVCFSDHSQFDCGWFQEGEK